MSPSPPARRRSLLALAVSFLTLGVGVLAAHFAPASGYEVSVYTETPLTFWVPVTVAFVAATYVAITARSTWAWVGGLVGSAGAVLSVGALPLFRGYYFYGPGDSMTHLGWVKDIVAGRLETIELLYPGIHTLSIAIARATGVELTRAMLFTVFAFLVLYAVFVPLTIWLLTDRRWLITAGAYAGMMFLTLNQVSMHYMSPHSFSQATHLLPLSIYAFVLYLVSRPNDAAVGEHRVTPIGTLFFLFSVGALLYHPEHAVNLVLVFGLALVVQLVARRVTFSHRILEHRSLFPQIGAFAVLTIGWTATHSRGSGAFDAVLRQLAGFVAGTAGVGEVVGQRTGSLEAIGASAEITFMKIFLVMALFAALAGALMLIAGTGRLNADRSDTSAIVIYLSLGLAALVPASMFVFVGNLSSLFFRNLGTIMAICTILGVLALGYIPVVASRSRRLRPLVRRVQAAWSRVGRARAALTIVLVIALVVHSTAILFTSPYIYRSNHQVSEQMIDGHATLFDYQAEGISIAELRGAPGRYLDAIYGTEQTEDPPALGNNSIEGLRSLGSQFDEPWYVTVSTYDRMREVVAYRGLRFNQAGFDSLDAQIGVDRVQDNGEVRTYLVS